MCFTESSYSLKVCSNLENPRDGGAWWAAVYGVTQSRTRLNRLSSSSSNLVLSKPISSIFPIAFAHKLFHDYYICYSSLRSVIFDVTPENRLQLAEGSDDGEQFFAIIYFLIKVSILFSFFFKV